MFSYQSEKPKFDFEAYPLPSDSIREMETHTKFDPGQEEDHFNNIALNYDEIMNAVGYPDPEFLATFAQKIAQAKNINLKEAETADFGCGTGLVGEAMKKHGFDKITGIDCSQAMLQISQDKDIYKSLYHVKLGGTDFV
jgi:predicted TPR repeat methyltransferase